MYKNIGKSSAFVLCLASESSDDNGVGELVGDKTATAKRLRVHATSEGTTFDAQALDADFRPAKSKAQTASMSTPLPAQANSVQSKIQARPRFAAP